MSTFPFTAWDCLAGGWEGALDHCVTWTVADKSIPIVCCGRPRELSITRGSSTRFTVAVGSEPFCKRPVHICRLLFCLPTGSITPPRRRMRILAVYGEAWLPAAFPGYDSEKPGLCSGCKHPELESWPARMGKTFLFPSTVALSFQFQLE